MENGTDKVISCKEEEIERMRKIVGDIMGRI